MTVTPSPWHRKVYLGEMGPDAWLIPAPDSQGAARKRGFPKSSVPNRFWQGNDDLYPEQPARLPWAEAIVEERIENNFKDAPSGRCLPGGPVVTGPYLNKLVQTPSVLVMILEDFVAVRQVFLDGRSHPKETNPSWYGHATGKWEGDTLVIDTVGFNDRGSINLYPNTERMHLTERYHRRDLAHLDIEVAIDDPGTFKHPWKLTMVWDLAPREEIQEYVCEDNNKDAAHLVGK